MKNYATLLTTAALALLPAATAQSLSAAQSKLDSGDWQGAVKAAVALNTSDGYALAAEATTLGAGASGGGKAQYTKAQDYAKKAISLNKNNASAYFELARAQGRLAQSAGIMQSLSLAGNMKSNLDKAIALNPKMASAYVALGLWHAELSAKGAAATMASGAKANQVEPNFKKAIALEPNRIIHRLEYARALMLLNSANKGNAKAQLQKAVSLPANTFWDKRDKQAAQAMLNKL